MLDHHARLGVGVVRPPVGSRSRPLEVAVLTLLGLCLVACLVLGFGFAYGAGEALAKDATWLPAVRLTLILGLTLLALPTPLHRSLLYGGRDMEGLLAMPIEPAEIFWRKQLAMNGPGQMLGMHALLWALLVSCAAGYGLPPVVLVSSVAFYAVYAFFTASSSALLALWRPACWVGGGLTVGGAAGLLLLALSDARELPHLAAVLEGDLAGLSSWLPATWSLGALAELPGGSDIAGAGGILAATAGLGLLCLALAHVAIRWRYTRDVILDEQRAAARPASVVEASGLAAGPVERFLRRHVGRRARAVLSVVGEREVPEALDRPLLWAGSITIGVALLVRALAGSAEVGEETWAGAALVGATLLVICLCLLASRHELTVLDPARRPDRRGDYRHPATESLPVARNELVCARLARSAAVCTVLALLALGFFVIIGTPPLATTAVVAYGWALALAWSALLLAMTMPPALHPARVWWATVPRLVGWGAAALVAIGGVLIGLSSLTVWLPDLVVLLIAPLATPLLVLPVAWLVSERIYRRRWFDVERVAVR